MNFLKKNMKLLRPDDKAHRGFTLIELMVVISVIAVLMGILLPTLRQARETAISMKCEAQLRQLGNAVMLYGQDNNDLAPLPVGPPLTPWWYTLLKDYIGGVDKTRCPSAADLITDKVLHPSSYGMNTFLWDGVATNPIKLSQIMRPSELSLMLDGKLIFTTTQYFQPTIGNPSIPTVVHSRSNTPYIPNIEDTANGIANAVFMDGRVESLAEDYLRTTVHMGSKTIWNP